MWIGLRVRSMQPWRQKAGRKWTPAATFLSWPWRSQALSRPSIHFTTEWEGAGVGGASVAEVLVRLRPRPTRTKLAPWLSISLIARPSNWSGELLKATRSPTTLTKTSRTWIRAWTKCSRSSLQALQRSRGVHYGSPAICIRGDHFGSHSPACGETEPQAGGLG